jgi:hypothetical protein
MRRMKKELKTTETKSIDDSNMNDSCLILQTIWRQKYAEKLFNIKKTEQATLLGMVTEFIYLSSCISFIIIRFYHEENYRLIIISMTEIRKGVIYNSNINKN